MQLKKFSVLLAALTAITVAAPPMIADAAPAPSTKSAKPPLKCKPGYTKKTRPGKGRLAGKTVTVCAVNLPKPQLTCASPLVFKQRVVTKRTRVNGKLQM